MAENQRAFQLGPSPRTSTSSWTPLFRPLHPEPAPPCVRWPAVPVLVLTASAAQLASPLPGGLLLFLPCPSKDTSSEKPSLVSARPPLLVPCSHRGLSLGVINTWQSLAASWGLALAVLTQLLNVFPEFHGVNLQASILPWIEPHAHRASTHLPLLTATAAPRGAESTPSISALHGVRRDRWGDPRLQLTSPHLGVSPLLDHLGRDPLGAHHPAGEGHQHL